MSPRLAAALLGTAVVITGCGSYRSHAAVVAAANGPAEVQAATTGGTTGDASGTSTGATSGTATGGTTGTTSGTATSGTTGSTSGTATSGTTGSTSGTATTGGTTGSTTGTATTGGTTGSTGGTSTTGKTTGTATTGKTTGAAASSPAASSGKQDTTPVMICQDGAFSGQAGPPFSNGQPALQAWVSFTNAHGGLAGHPVKLDSKDDGADTNKALQNVQNCVENEHSVAVVGSFLPLAADSVIPYLEKQKVPLIGGDSLLDSWYGSAYAFPTGASPQGSTNGEVAGIKKVGKGTPATIYCAETPSCSLAQKLFVATAQAAGIPVKDNFQTSLANPSFTSQCSSMQSDKIDSVFIALDGPSISRLARDCNAIGFKPLYVTSGLALDADAAAQDPNLEGMIVANTVFPWSSSGTPAATDFQTAMSTYASDVATSESAAVGWTSGQMLARAVALLGDAAKTKPITSAMLLQGMDMYKAETVGGLFPGPQTFTAGKGAPKTQCYGISTIKGGKWTPLLGGTGVACP